MARLTKEPIFATNNEAALNMFSSRLIFLSIYFPHCAEECRSPETMLAFLRLLENKYGGVEQYLRTYVQLTNDDITTIRSNLLVAVASNGN